MSYALIPESAPFSPEQREWLNGFFAGWIGLDSSTQRSGDEAVAALSSAVAMAPPPATDEAFPWHDPSLTIVTRLELAEGKPLARRLMAAMAQLDCGACGYVCKTYSEAIASGAETNLRLCSPGGKNTVKAIKQLLSESAEANAATRDGSATASSNGHGTHGGGYHRNNPFLAKVKSSRNLNRPGSAKHTAHVVLDLSGSGLVYKPGDALGVYPTNPPELVDTILTAARLDADLMVPAPSGQEVTLRDALRRQYCLRSATEELLQVLARSASSVPEATAAFDALADESYENFDVLDAIELVPSAEIEVSEFLATLPPLSPRLYSIASSLRAHAEEVHLTVGRVAYEANGRQRLGVASTMFADRINTGDAVGVFVHAAGDFTVPSDPAAPMIMVGPGTGIAPFRAFLEERQAVQATGQNWLFFGDQCSATDFLYQNELALLQASGVLTRLDLAFSRDQPHKVYVQDRMREQGAELFRWLEAGGYFFVCGDAQRMAADVDRALHEVIAAHGQMCEADAATYVRELKRQKRYVRDVY